MIQSFDQFVAENRLDEGRKSHEAFKLVTKFLKRFPTDADSWANATDEVRDLARSAREIYAEFDLNVDPEGDDNRLLKAVDFRKIKTPSEWNTKGREFIMKALGLMSDQALNAFVRYNGHMLRQ